MGLAIVLLAVLHATGKYPTADGRLAFVSQLERLVYDTRLRLTMPQSAEPNIVILDIDEASLAEIGHWPWSRSVMAKLVPQLFDHYGVAVLGFDIVWAERDRSSGIDTLDALARDDLKRVPGFRELYESLRPTLDNDGLFAGAMRGRPVVLGYYFTRDERALRVNAIPPPVLPKGSLAVREMRVGGWAGYTGNLPLYLKSAAAAGHFNPLVDEDGVSRRIPMLLQFDGAYYEPLSLAVVRTYLSLQDRGRLPGVEPQYAAGGALEWLKVGPLKIPVDGEAAVLIPYRGGKRSFQYVALADVIKERIDPSKLRGKIALIGGSAPGLHDLRATPVGNLFPGVEIHASVISGILGGRIKERAPVPGTELALVLAVGLAAAILFPLLPALWATLAAAAGVALLLLVDYAAWTRGDLALPLAAPLLVIVALYLCSMAYGYFVESRSRRQFAELFGQYVPPELVDRMAADPARYSMEPRSAELTILFADVRGFTGISEALRPEELREYINWYLTEMSSIIRGRYRGTLDKYMGDAIMAFWGAPVDDEQHARNGVLAALDMQKECEVLNAKFAARAWPTLRIGIGVNSGVVRVGDMGSRLRRAYTAMGDAVNVASRLERRTKGYAVAVLVGEATQRRVGDVVFREVDRVRVLGKESAITIYEPLGRVSEVGEKALDELELWNSTLRAYRGRQWDQAEIDLADLVRMNPTCGLYRAYAARLAEKRRNPPPPAWDGISSFDEK
jgi:adenylate cyclase